MSPTLHQLLVLLIGALVALATMFLIPYLKAELAKLSAERRQQVFQFADMAFGVVEELARKTETDLDDKAVEGLKQLEEMLRNAGMKPLTAAETQLAKARFDALHAAVKSAAPTPT
jgi:predicted secreted protein